MKGSKHTLAQALYIRDTASANLSRVRDMADCNPNDPSERKDQVTRRQAFSLTAVTDRNGIVRN